MIARLCVVSVNSITPSQCVAERRLSYTFDKPRRRCDQRLDPESKKQIRILNLYWFFLGSLIPSTQNHPQLIHNRLGMGCGGSNLSQSIND